MINEENILSLVKAKGPVLPVDIAKSIGTNILMASACLSELVDNKKLRLSNTKIGGSPVYFLKEQKAQLQELYQHLNDKDQRAFDSIKEKKILKDAELEPLMRVAFRNIKDFAVPLYVTHNGNKFLFWKWYLIENDEAEGLIRLQLKPQQEVKKEKITVKKEEKIEKDEPKKEIIALEESKLKEEKEKIKVDKLKKEGVNIEENKLKKEREKIKEERNLIEKEKIKLEKQRKLIEEKSSEKPKEIVKEKKQEIDEEFFEQLKKFFGGKKIEVSSYEIIRKKLEIDFILRVPSVVGSLDYYCKAKNKKRVSDTDLSAAFVQGQLKKLPVLFLITGELTKKAKELLNTEFKKGLVVRKI